MGSRSRARARAQVNFGPEREPSRAAAKQSRPAAGRSGTAAEKPGSATSKPAPAGKKAAAEDAAAKKPAAGKAADENPAAAAQPPQRSRLLIGAAVIQAIQASGVLVASVLVGIDAATGKSYHLNSGIALTLIGFATAVALGYVAVGLSRARPWSRTPALLTQLFTGIVSIYLVQGQKYEWGVPGLILALAGFATILAPPSLRALTGQKTGESAGGAS